MTIIYHPFDIETTGLHASAKTVSIAFEDFSHCSGSESDVLHCLSQKAAGIAEEGSTIVTFYGGTLYKPGFDFPHLRTRYVCAGQAWPFGGIPHIDIYSILKARFNSTVMMPVELDNLKVDELKKLGKEFNIILAGNKQPIIDKIAAAIDQDAIREYLDTNFEPKKIESNTLDHFCEIFKERLGPLDPERNIGGAMVPVMFREYQQTGDESILEKIRSYNEYDVWKTGELLKIVLECVPAYDLRHEVL